MVNFESFLIPPSLYLAEPTQQPRIIKSLPERLDAALQQAVSRYSTLRTLRAVMGEGLICSKESGRQRCSWCIFYKN